MKLESMVCTGWLKSNIYDLQSQYWSVLCKMHIVIIGFKLIG